MKFKTKEKYQKNKKQREMIQLNLDIKVDNDELIKKVSK